MRRTLFVALPAGLIALAAGFALQPTRSPAQPAPAVKAPDDGATPATLPVTRVTLFNSGVGYFQREGEVSGNARVDPSFSVPDLNDLLKSMDLEDRGNGRVSAVGYDSPDPVEKTLQAFVINLGTNPSSGQILNQARGEKVEVTLQQTGVAQPPITGSVMGVEHQKQPVGKDAVVEVAVLNLWCVEGMRSVKLADVQRVRFLNPALDSDVKRALDVLARTHDSRKKAVSLNCVGAGKRTVRVGYVVEHPMWKASYRLALAKDGKPKLHAFAQVENPSDDDWKDVRLALVAGRPISFRMDLYNPLYVPRPLIEPELFASLRPPTYEGALVGKEGVAKRDEKPAPAAAPPPAPNELPVKTAALGEFYQYVLEDPVSLPRQKSSLFPIARKEVEVIRVSIYNEKTQPKHPLLGLRFKNSTGLHLTQGPVTVFDQGGYAGDARLLDMQPSEEGLLSFAVDLGTEVEAFTHQSSERLTTVRIQRGVLWTTTILRESKTYRARNRSVQDRTLLIEHPFRPDWKLMTEPKPVELTRDVYRFEIQADAGKNTAFTVVEEKSVAHQVLLTNSDDPTLGLYLKSQVSSAKVKEALEKAVALRQKLAEARQEVAAVEQTLKELIEDQTRVRANLERLPPASDGYKRNLKKIDEQETEIEKMQEALRRTRTVEKKQRKEYEDYLSRLVVE